MPRKRRSFATRKRLLSAPAAVFIRSSLANKQKQWMEESMLATLKAVEEGKSVSRASRDSCSEEYLYDRVRGRVIHGVKPGPKPYLNQTEEKELGSYLKHCAKLGYLKTIRDVLSLPPTNESDLLCQVIFLTGGCGVSRSVREICL